MDLDLFYTETDLDLTIAGLFVPRNKFRIKVWRIVLVQNLQSVAEHFSMKSL